MCIYGLTCVNKSRLPVRGAFFIVLLPLIKYETQVDADKDVFLPSVGLEIFVFELLQV